MNFSVFVIAICFADITISLNTFKMSRKLFPPKEKLAKCFGLICNNTSRYPEKYISKLLNKNKKNYPGMFGIVIEPTKNIMIPKERFTFSEEENLCETKKITIFPKVAYDADLVQRFIVNIKDHEQRVLFEVCVESKCFGGEALLNYQTFCKQLYTSVRLLYVTEEGKLKYGKFTAPSTCVCMYKKYL